MYMFICKYVLIHMYIYSHTYVHMYILISLFNSTHAHILTTLTTQMSISTIVDNICGYAICHVAVCCSVLQCVAVCYRLAYPQMSSTIVDILISVVKMNQFWEWFFRWDPPSPGS